MFRLLAPFSLGRTWHANCCWIQEGRMSTDEPVQSVRSYWRDNRNKRELRGRSPYQGRNVIKAARWAYVRACRNCDQSSNALKLSTAQLAAAEDQIIAMAEDEVLLVVSEVLARLGHPKKARQARLESRGDELPAKKPTKPRTKKKK